MAFIQINSTGLSQFTLQPLKVTTIATLNLDHYFWSLLIVNGCCCDPKSILPLFHSLVSPSVCLAKNPSKISAMDAFSNGPFSSFLTSSKAAAGGIWIVRSASIRVSSSSLSRFMYCNSIGSGVITKFTLFQGWFCPSKQTGHQILNYPVCTFFTSLVLANGEEVLSHFLFI